MDSRPEKSKGNERQKAVAEVSRVLAQKVNESVANNEKVIVLKVVIALLNWGRRRMP